MATGKYAWSISDKSGLRFPYREMIREPGTFLWIHPSESDGIYNRVDHPQNFPKVPISDDISLDVVKGNNAPVQPYLWDDIAGWICLEGTWQTILLDSYSGEE